MRDRRPTLPTATELGVPARASGSSGLPDHLIIFTRSHQAKGRYLVRVNQALSLHDPSACRDACRQVHSMLQLGADGLPMGHQRIQRITASQHHESYLKTSRKKFLEAFARAGHDAALVHNGSTQRYDNPHGHEHTAALARALEHLCEGGDCSRRTKGTFHIKEPPGCIGRRGVARNERFRWLACKIRRPNCLVVSIGVGNEWDFELVALELGCEVHAFDPTVGLLQEHNRTANIIRRTYPGLHFHFLGLGSHKIAGMRNDQTAYTGPLASGDSSAMGPMAQLPQLLRIAGVAEGRQVDVLNIDCEGCEWEAVRHIAFKHPRSLCNVQQLNIELHTYRSELSNASDLPTLLRHIWVDHGFRVFRNVPNEGWFSPLELRQLPEVHNQPVNIIHGYCCYNVQMVRSSRSPHAVCAGRS